MDRCSGANRIYRVHLPLCRPEPIGHAHPREHRVVDVDALRPDIHDLACLETAVRAGDRVKNARQLSLDVVVTSVTRLSRDGD